LREGKLESLEELAGQPLRYLGLRGLSKLSNIAPVSTLANLEELHIEECPVLDLMPIARLARLENLHIEMVKGSFENLSGCATCPS
jgi:hypothetical protein